MNPGLHVHWPEIASQSPSFRQRQCWAQFAPNSPRGHSEISNANKVTSTRVCPSATAYLSHSVCQQNQQHTSTCQSIGHKCLHYHRSICSDSRLPNSQVDMVFCSQLQSSPQGIYILQSRDGIWRSALVGQGPL